MRGTWREVSFTGDPEDMLIKALEMDVCLHRVLTFEKNRGTLLS